MTKTQVLLYDQKASFEVPSTIPSKAEHVITLEWSSSPNNYMQNSYMISQDPSHVYWLLWIEAEDNEEDSADQLVAFVKNSDVNIKDAAVSLLKAYWNAYYKEYGTPDKNYKLVNTGILDENDLKNIVSGINII
jgi:hypothetical protein